MNADLLVMPLLSSALERMFLLAYSRNNASRLLVSNYCPMHYRLVDTDCKWGFNRAGRPPDPFWEVCGRSVPRKILTSHDKVR